MIWDVELRVNDRGRTEAPAALPVADVREAVEDEGIDVVTRKVGEFAGSVYRSAGIGRSRGVEDECATDSPLVPPGIATRLEVLRTDFEEVTGASFEHFYCPILYGDEPVELCKAHIVNRVFEGTPRAWTVQRKDVDNHFGAKFESGFTALADYEDIKAQGGLTGKRLPYQFKTRVLAGSEGIPYFSARKPPGPEFTALRVKESNRWFFLRRTPEEVDRLLDDSWCIETTADLSVSAAVSLIKSAHLTLFALLGYGYALSCGGHLIGAGVLGSLLRETVSCSLREAEERARSILREWAHVVRPMKGGAWGVGGTITDGSVLIAWTGSGNPWGAIVRVAFQENDFAVLLPCCWRADEMVTYLDFMRNGREEIRVKVAQLDAERGQMGVDERDFPVRWPKSEAVSDWRAPLAGGR